MCVPFATILLTRTQADASSVDFAWNSVRMFVKSYLKDILTAEETHAVIKNIYFSAVDVCALLIFSTSSLQKSH